MNLNFVSSAIGVLFMASLGSAQAAVVLTENFSSGYGSVGSQLAPGGGWTINEAQGIGGPPGPLSFIGTLGSVTFGKSGALGGALDEPSGSNPTISLVRSGLGAEFSTTSLSVTFAILGSIDFPLRDGFGFSLRDAGGANLFSIGFEIGGASTFRVNYTVGGGSSVYAQNDLNGDPMYIAIDGLYTLNLAFMESGINPTFEAELVGSNTESFSGVATGMGSSVINQFAVDWDLVGKGGNHIVFDNLTVSATAVPEPSGLVLGCLGALGLLRRRR